jgi:nucleotide-binding universal stress UspA family protein
MRENPAPTPPDSGAKPLFHRLLLPFDFSVGARRVIPFAVEFAKRSGATLAFLQVVPAVLPADVSHVSLAFQQRKLLDLARGELGKFVGEAIPTGIRTDILVAEGGPYNEINAVARTTNADLILVSTHGYSGARQMMIGSTTERVVRHAPCPVLSWHGNATPPADGQYFQRILVPVDFSDANAESLRHASAFAAMFGGSITLAHVVEPPKYPTWGYAHLVRRDESLKADAAKNLQPLRASLESRGCTVDPPVIVAGDADTQICRLASERKLDLIVLPTHGRSGLTQVFLGGTAERVVRHATVPVLVVRGNTSASS